MKKNTVIMAVVGALAAGALVSGATVAFAQADVIKARQENRKATGPEDARHQGRHRRQGPTSRKSAVTHAAKLEGTRARVRQDVPGRFGQGRDQGPADGVERHAGLPEGQRECDAAFDKLAVAAGSGDMAALPAAFGDVGKACGACHTKYRAKLN